MSRRVPARPALARLDEELETLGFIVDMVDHAAVDDWPAWMFLVYPRVKAAREALRDVYKERSTQAAKYTSCAVKDESKGEAAP